MIDAPRRSLCRCDRLLNSPYFRNPMLRFLQQQLIPYIRLTLLPSRPAQLIIQTAFKWNQDNVPGMAASLSYYALFSIFPLLIVILSIVGALVGPETEAFGVIQGAIARYLPPEVHELVKETVIALNQNSVGAGVIGFGLLLFAASTVFAVLRRSVNNIWKSHAPASNGASVYRMASFFLLNKLSAFLLVLGTALLLFVSLISNILIRAILKLVTNFQETFAFINLDSSILSWGLQASSSFLILALAICILFKVLPDIRLHWRDVWLGAFLTSILLAGLQQLVSSSVVSVGGRFLSYGVVGSVMILMLWIFLTCQIFFLGCEFSYVYAHLFGSYRHQTRAPLPDSSSR